MQANAEVIEIIDLIDPKFKHEFEDERTARYISVGGLLENQLLICGGWDAISNDHFQDCIFLGQQTYGSTSTNLQMLEERIEAASVVLNQKILWITGGYLKNSTEFISLADQQSAVIGPDLPFSGIFGHKMLQVDSKTIYIIGGNQGLNHLPTSLMADPFLDTLREFLHFSKYLNGTIS